MLTPVVKCPDIILFISGFKHRIAFLEMQEITRIRCTHGTDSSISGSP